jgi:hypothetical protein
VTKTNQSHPYPHEELALCNPCHTAYPVRLVLPTQLQVDWFCAMFKDGPPPRGPVTVPDHLLPEYLPSGTKWDAHKLLRDNFPKFK